MSNPWLRIPLADYEGHMAAAEVQQLEALSDLFGEALARSQPESIAVLGIAGGNGLDRIDGKITKRVVGLDVNPLYLNETRRRYGGRFDLELHCIDLAEQHVGLDPVHLVHAALVFEHAGVDQCLENALSFVAAGGALSVVLQFQNDSIPGVSATRYPSMQTLKSGFSLIDPAWFRQTLAERGFSLTHEAQRELPGGKGLWLGVFSQ